jgi:hypothetical protein
MIFPEHDLCEKIFHPSSFPSIHCVTKDATGKHIPCLRLSPRKNFLLEFKGRLNALRRSLISQSVNLPLSSCQSSSKFLFIPSQASRSDKIQRSQSSKSLSQPYESLSYHNTIQRWIEHSCANVTWHNLVPRSS